MFRIILTLAVFASTLAAGFSVMGFKCSNCSGESMTIITIILFSIVTTIVFFITSGEKYD